MGEVENAPNMRIDPWKKLTCKEPKMYEMAVPIEVGVAGASLSLRVMTELKPRAAFNKAKTDVAPDD